jgi:hypothetical protein
VVEVVDNTHHIQPQDILEVVKVVVAMVVHTQPQVDQVDLQELLTLVVAVVVELLMVIVEHLLVERVVQVSSS